MKNTIYNFYAIAIFFGGGGYYGGGGVLQYDNDLYYDLRSVLMILTYLKERDLYRSTHTVTQ